MSELSGGTPPQDDPIQELASVIIDLAYAEDAYRAALDEKTKTEGQWDEAFQRAVYHIEDSAEDGRLAGENLVAALTDLVHGSGNRMALKKLEEALNFRDELSPGQYIYDTKRYSRVQIIIEDPEGRAIKPVLKVNPRYESAYPGCPQLAYEVTVADEDGQPDRIIISKDEYDAGEDAIERSLDDELDVASKEGSPDFYSVMLLVKNFEFLGKPEKAAVAEQVLAAIVLESGNLDSYSPSDLTYIRVHLPDALQHVYDRFAKNMSDHSSVSSPAAETEFAKAYLMATNLDFNELSQYEQTNLVFETLLKMNQRGHELLREAEAQK